jgi:hypothetical protein
MCDPKDLYKFIAYAKICSCRLSCDYVHKTNNGYDTEDLMNKIRLLKSYILSIESYIYPSCNDVYCDGLKILDNKKVIPSKNNSLYLNSKEGKENIKSEDLNCLTEEQVCELAERIKGICANC